MVTGQTYPLVLSRQSCSKLQLERRVSNMAHLGFSREFLVALGILASVARAQFNCPLCSCGPRETLQLLVEAGPDGCPACTCVPGEEYSFKGQDFNIGSGVSPPLAGARPRPVFPPPPVAQPPQPPPAPPLAGARPRPVFPAPPVAQPQPPPPPPPPLAGARPKPVFPLSPQPAPQPAFSGDGPPQALTATVR